MKRNYNKNFLSILLIIEESVIFQCSVQPFGLTKKREKFDHRVQPGCLFPPPAHTHTSLCISIPGLKNHRDRRPS